MKYIVKRNPSISLMNDFEKIFDSFWDYPTVTSRVRKPSVDVRETEENYILEAELPGFDEKQIEVNVDKHVLHISSKKEESKAEQVPVEKDEYLLRERALNSFDRSFSLPEQVDEEHIAGEFKQGILTLTIPKRPEKKPKKIDVKLAS